MTNYIYTYLLLSTMQASKYISSVEESSPTHNLSENSSQTDIIFQQLPVLEPLKARAGIKIHVRTTPNRGLKSYGL